LSVRVEEHEEGPSAMMRKADRDRERDDRGGGGFRGDREGGGFRGGDRDGGGFRGDRGPRRPREDADASAGDEEEGQWRKLVRAVRFAAAARPARSRARTRRRSTTRIPSC